MQCIFCNLSYLEDYALSFETANTKHNQLFVIEDFPFVDLVCIQGKCDKLIMKVL